MLLKYKSLFTIPGTSSLFVQEHWRKPYSNFIVHRILPSNHSGIMKIKRKSRRLIVEEGQLFARCYKKAPLKFFQAMKLTRVLKEGHVGVCGKHQRSFNLFNNWLIWVIIRPPWKLMQLPLLKDGQHASLMAIKIRVHLVELHSLSTPWRFHMWALINPPSMGYIWILLQ